MYVYMWGTETEKYQIVGKHLIINIYMYIKFYDIEKGIVWKLFFSVQYSM